VNNKLIISLLVLTVLVVGFNTASHAYRHEFREWAVAVETDKAGLELGTAVIDGKTVSFLKSDLDKPAMVMLHGFSADKNSWVRLAQALQGEFQLIVPDLLGHGDNVVDFNQSYGTQNQVAFVHKLMAELGIEKFHLVGNSMGGGISSLYAARYPEQVLSLTLVSPAGVHDIPSELDKALEQGHNPIIAGSEDEFYALLDFMMDEPPFIPSAIAEAEAERFVARQEINQKIFADLRADLDLKLDREFVNVKAPALIIWGEQDRAIHVGNIEAYAQKLNNARTEVIDGIGHLAMIEVPEYTADLMMDFISN